MSKKSNPTLIGAFVVGAVLLLATGVALFGGAELFAKRNFYSAYFVQDTKGLREGSNVVLNGVRIGFVSGVALYVDQKTFESQTEVTIEVLPESFIVTRDGSVIGEGMRKAVSHEELIKKGGLRAMIQTESLVTGQSLVQLALRPDTEPVFRAGPDSRYPEIPTMPSGIQELMGKVEAWIADLTGNLDPEDIGQTIESLLHGIDELANSQDIRAALAGLDRIVNKEETQELTVTLNSAFTEFDKASRDAGALFTNADKAVAELDIDLQPVVERMVGALDEAQKTLAAATLTLRGDSAEGHQLVTTLKEVEGAARALREFLDFLDRNPEALIRGKKE